MISVITQKIGFGLKINKNILNVLFGDTLHQYSITGTFTTFVASFDETQQPLSMWMYIAWALTVSICHQGPFSRDKSQMRDLGFFWWGFGVFFP